ncbi:MAG: hypothetical protein Q4F65_01115 [Propionibacteriaceae bacterium]|nr:hypothetical protein [Propionibacteriaceae bacterium]
MADALAALELLGVVAFANEAARDLGHPNPDEGQVAYVGGASGGVCVYTATGWRYLAWRDQVTP